MRNNLMVAYAVIWLMCFSACAFANGIVSRREVLSALPPKLQWIAREKIRAGWSPPIWLLPLVKAHGLNAIFPRLELPPTGHHDYEKCKRQFRKMSRECKRLGLHMFHVLNAGDRWFNRSYGYKDNPRRLNGSRNAPRDDMPPCPLDQTYWRRVLEERMLALCEIYSGDECQLDGFLIDSEMYGFGGKLYWGTFCYCDFCFDEFARDAKLDARADEIPLQHRYEFLKRRTMLSRYQAYQVKRVEEMIAATVRRVHKRMPHLIFGFMPYSGTPLEIAVARGMAVGRTPVLIAPESTYWSGYTDEFDTMAEACRRAIGKPVLYVPGFFFREWEMDAIAGHLYALAMHSDGYWLFALYHLDGVDDKLRMRYLAQFKRANDELDRYMASGGAYESSLKPAPRLPRRPGNLLELFARAHKLKPVNVQLAGRAFHIKRQDGKRMDVIPILRGAHIFICRADKGQSISFRLRGIPLGHYPGAAAFVLYGDDGIALARGIVPKGKEERFDVDVPRAGAYLLHVEAGAIGFQLTPLNPPMSILQSRISTLPQRDRSGVVGAFYFYVPRDTKLIEITLSGSPNEGGRIIVRDGNGDIRAQAVVVWNGSPRQATLRITPGVKSDEIWSIALDQSVEDLSFQINGVDGIFAFAPEDLYAAVR